MPFASKMDGIRKFTSPDGRRIIEGWLNGRLARRDTYCSTTDVNITETWHPNGIKRSEVSTVDGLLHGTETRLDESGEICAISTWRHGVNAGREYSLDDDRLVDGERHGYSCDFRGWITDRDSWKTSYVDHRPEGMKVRLIVTVPDGAWFRREAALLCRGGR